MKTKDDNHKKSNIVERMKPLNFISIFFLSQTSMNVKVLPALMGIVLTMPTCILASVKLALQVSTVKQVCFILSSVFVYAYVIEPPMVKPLKNKFLLKLFKGSQP